MSNEKTITKQDLEKSLSGVAEGLNETVKKAVDGQEERIIKEVENKIKSLEEMTENKFNEIKVKKDFEDNNNFGLKSFGEFANIVMKKSLANKNMRSLGDEETHKIKALTDYMQENKKALNESIDSMGGFLVPTQFANNLITRSIDNTNLMRDCGQIETKTNSIKLPVANDTDRSSGQVHGGVQFYWIDEQGEYTESAPTYNNLKFELNKLGALYKVSDELLDDNVVALESWLPKQFQDGFVYTTDQVIMRGDGNGKPKGILNSGGVVQIDTSGQTTAIELSNITDMLSRMPSDGDKNAKWYINRDMMTSLISLTLGDQPIFMFRNSLAERPHDMLLGRPIVWTEHASELKTPGDIILADMSKYMVCTKENAALKMSSSMHVDFVYDKQAFKFVYRMDGQTLYNKPFKYPNNQNDKGYIITLDARND